MSQINEQTDNHKRDSLIPTACWNEDVVVNVDLVKRNLLDIQKKLHLINQE